MLASEDAVGRTEREGRCWMVADELHLRGRIDTTLVYEPAPSADVRLPSFSERPFGG